MTKQRKEEINCDYCKIEIEKGKEIVSGECVFCSEECKDIAVEESI